MVHDAVAAIDAALAETSHPERLTALVAGHLAYGDGIALATRELDAEALPYFVSAAGQLAAGGSPFAARTVLRAAVCEHYLARYEAVLTRLGGLRQQIDMDRYPNLAGDLLWSIALAKSKGGDFSVALGLFREALARFSTTGEKENVAFLNFLIAESFRFQGETHEVWRHRYEALRAVREVPRSVWFHNTLLDSAEAALSQGLPEVALLFQNEMVATEMREADPDPTAMAEALLRRIRTRCHLAAFELAEDDFRNARLWLERIESPQRRGYLAAELDSSEGECEISSHPEEAVNLLSSAIQYAEGGNARYRLPVLYLGRASAFLAAERIDAAESDLETGIGEYEAQRVKVRDQGLRISFFDRAQAIFDEMIRFQVERRGQPDRAFEYSERARGRALLDVVAKNDGEKARTGVLALHRIQASLPGDVALLEYSSTQDVLFVWIVTREGLDLVEIAVDQQRLTTLVRLLRTGITSDSRQGSTKLAASLYDLLLRPVLAKIPADRRLVVVPDKALHLLPFAALLDRQTNRYLIEDRLISFAPSATLYLRALDRSRRVETRAGTGVLVVGNPRIDRKLFPGLSNLRGADREATAIAGQWRADILTGEQATRAAFLREAPLHRLVHVASHARVSTDYPLFSSLLLAPEDDEGGELFARDILGMRFEETQLVVLAACETADGDLSAGEGISSLVRPFLAAGVPSVVGSLWPVEDQESAALFTRFYQRTAEGADFATALRDAQLFLIHHPDPRLRKPAAWSGFQLLGGPLPSAE